MDYQVIEAGTHDADCKCRPARRPRYEARVVASALAAGHRYALGNDCTAYVIPTHYGYALDYRRGAIPFGHPFYAVDRDGTVTINKYPAGGRS